VLRFIISLAICLTLVAAAQYPPGLDPAKRKPAKKKKKEEPEITQTLEVLPEPPATSTMATANLGFLVSPLSAKGLLSQQTRDGLKALRTAARGAQIVKLRAFVAGNGDLRRVPSLVSEVFTEARQPLPSVSVIQVGALPLEGAQIVMEAAVAERRAVNPNGVGFLSGQLVRATTENPRAVNDVLSESLDNLKKASSGNEVLRVTCFVSLLEDTGGMPGKIAAVFPKAAVNLVQLQRLFGPALAECEGVSRLATAPASPIERVNPAGLTASTAYSQVVNVNTPKLLFTTTQQAFGADPSSLRLAFDRLKKMLDPLAMSQIAMAHIYSLSGQATDQFRAVRFDYYDKSQPPGSTLLQFEALPSVDATLGIDVIAAAP
jgi:enamine deaminase RidA (YjgF/YER057c/UK114 family)